MVDKFTRTIVGFDSAWTDNPKAPGAVCAAVFAQDKPLEFYPPHLASFAEALSFIREVSSRGGVTFVALDQPTIVRNFSSMRPVERAAASLVSWLGGGVQPSNRGRKGMFCDDAPIWKFLEDLGAIEDPESVRSATHGMYIAEVFPAFALASLNPAFFGRMAAPRYNPARRKTFKYEDWVRVAETAADQFDAFGLSEAASLCRDQSKVERPNKGDQDKLDAMLCLIVGTHWLLRCRSASLFLGSLEDGYMISPASPEVRSYITTAAFKVGVKAI